MDIVHTHSYATGHDYVTVRRKLIVGLIIHAVMHLDAVWDFFYFIHVCIFVSTYYIVLKYFMK